MIPKRYLLVCLTFFLSLLLYIAAALNFVTIAIWLRMDGRKVVV